MSEPAYSLASAYWLRARMVYADEVDSYLLSDAEGAEDEIENVIGSGLPGQRVEGP
jgi:hypothetical protein